jgi:hypothetical protein
MGLMVLGRLDWKQMSQYYTSLVILWLALPTKNWNAKNDQVLIKFIILQ